MIDAITTSKERIYAFDTDVNRLKRLSDMDKLRCPYCNKIVKYKAGGKNKSPHFSHLPNNNCYSKRVPAQDTKATTSKPTVNKDTKSNQVPIKKINNTKCPKCNKEYEIEYIKGTGYLAKCDCSSKVSIIQPICPSCNSKMYLRKNSKDNKYFWGCSKYPECKCTKEFDLK